MELTYLCTYCVYCKQYKKIKNVLVAGNIRMTLK